MHEHIHGGFIVSWTEQLLTALHFPDSVAHFIAAFLGEFVNMLLILIAIYLVVSFLQTFVGVRKRIAALAKMPRWIGYFAAAILGFCLPMCSCTIVPLFMALVTAHVPLGVCFTLLASTSLINMTSIVTITSLIGWQTGAVYAVTGALIAIVIGFVIDIKDQSANIISDVGYEFGDDKPLFSERIGFALSNTLHILSTTWIYLAIGVLLSVALEHLVDVFPLEGFLNANAALLIPVAGIIGSFLHCEAITLIPLMHTLLSQGMNLGLAVTFILTSTGISIPVYVMLSRVLKKRLLNLYVLLVSGLSIVAGYILMFV